TDRKVKVTKVIFDSRQVPFISRLLEMEARCGVLNQRAIKIVLAILRRCQSPEYEPILDMKATLEGMILSLLHQGRSFVVETQSLVKSTCRDLYDSCSNKKDSLKSIIVFQSAQGTFQMNARLIVRALTPVAKRKIALSFSSFHGFANPLEQVDASRN